MQFSLVIIRRLGENSCYSKSLIIKCNIVDSILNSPGLGVVVLHLQNPVEGSQKNGASHGQLRRLWDLTGQICG